LYSIFGPREGPVVDSSENSDEPSIKGNEFFHKMRHYQPAQKVISSDKIIGVFCENN
jgi:hypothetical protein